MQLKNITLRGLKGQERSIDLAPRTVLTGPNGSGKTAALQAILVALTGQDPALGKAASRNALAPQNGSPWGVTLQAARDDGGISRVTRDWGAGGKPGESARIIPGSKPKETLTKVNQAIAMQFGEQSGSVELGKLLSMTAGERARYLLDLVDGQDGHGVESLLDLLGDCPDDLVTRVQDVWADDQPITVNLDCALAEIKDAVSTGDRAEKESRAARARISESAMLADQEVSEAPMKAAEAQEKREALRTELAQIQKDIAANRERKEAWDAMKRRVASAQKAQEDADLAVQRLRKEIAKAQPSEPAPDPAKIQELTKRCTQLEGEKDSANAARAAAEANHKALEKRLAGMSGDDCPTCGGALAGARSTAEAELTAARSALKECSATYTEALEVLDEARAQLRQLNELDRQHERMSAFRERLADAEAAAEQRKQAWLDAAREEQESPGLVDAESLQKQEAALAQDIQKYDAHIARAERSRERSSQLLGADEAERVATKTATNLRAVQKRARAAAAELTAKLLNPVVGKASELISGVNPDWAIEARSEGSGIAFWARTNASAEAIPWSVLSGGEAVVFGAALALALVRLRNPACSLLLLEAAEVDPDRLAKLLSAIDSMGQGFSNVIIATCHQPSTVAEWKVVDLGACKNAGTGAEVAV